MKRKYLTDELFCKTCENLGKEETFINKPGSFVCPVCGGINTVIMAVSVDWCDECQTRPQAKGFCLCSTCIRNQEKTIRHLQASGHM